MMKNKIINYILNKYEPHTIILYGSYADGSNNINSDFDALVITDKKCKFHDGNEADGIKLDVFIYNTSLFKNDINYEEYVQIHDGNIVIDKYGIGKKLQEKVCEFIKNMPKKSREEKQHQIEWCEKMFLRTKREDAEGYFRWHWLLVDSLEIYFSICDEYYYGPKKSLAKLKNKNPEAFNYYNNALTKFDFESLKEWIDYLKKEIT
ncbi:nucleotidyltransferase domain-containing protein [Clostridium botulinum]|uniref:nucleotidyltransferase domain-containing protein n=1 Tax=Clostridium botulinum TaxID=1491 RepID=UPI001FAF78C8|nr:nucleotidyltransferase domain-containing protein [Clostridium botulinum]